MSEGCFEPGQGWQAACLLLCFGILDVSLRGWDLVFFPDCWDVGLVKAGLKSLCAMFSFGCYGLYSVPEALCHFIFFGGFLFGCFGFRFRLDEDCNPGWEDCGRSAPAVSCLVFCL